MNSFALFPFVVLGLSPAVSVANSVASGFVPPLGETYYYRYAETLAGPHGTRGMTATLTLKTFAENSVLVTFAVDGQGSRDLDFFVDQTGAMQPVGIWIPNGPRGADANAQIQQRAVIDSLLLRLALVSRVGARLETTFPIQVGVAWAAGPVNPILSIKSDDPHSFVADASASTYINPPGPSSVRRLGQLLPLSLGLAGAFVSAATGKLITFAGAGTSLLATAGAPSGPQPVDVKLHLSGKFGEARLQSISGEQQDVVHTGRRSSTTSDKWSLVAG